MTFKPGVSGNPIGRPKAKLYPFTANDLKKHFAKWKALVESNVLEPSEQVKAVEHLVTFMSDRLNGKPAQAVDVTSGDKPLAAIVSISLNDLTKSK